MRRTIISAFLLLGMLTAYAQNGIDIQEGTPQQKGNAWQRFTDSSDMSFQMRGSFQTCMPQGGNTSARFRMDDLRWNIEGTAGKNLYYRFRQSFTTAFQSPTFDNILSSVNYAFIRWNPCPELALTAGKQVFALGGHEFWAVPVYVMHFSDFGSSLAAYQMGLSAEWKLTPRQELHFQISNLRGKPDSEYYIGGLPEGMESSDAPFLYTLNWNGTFLPDNSLELRYSGSYGQQARDAGMWIVALGQSFRNRKWGAYLDFIWSRQDLDASSLMSSSATFPDGTARTLKDTEYWSAIGYLHFFFSPTFGAFVKGAAECAGIYRTYMDVSPGICRTNWNAQACFEYMPTRDSDFRIFAHYNYYTRSATDRGRLLGMGHTAEHTISLGVIYIMKVF